MGFSELFISSNCDTQKEQRYSRSNNWGLPSGFRVEKTPKGRLYFIDDNAEKTHWEDPRPLPRGWRTAKREDGRVYFVDDNTKTTTWNDPRPKIFI